MQLDYHHHHQSNQALTGRLGILYIAALCRACFAAHVPYLCNLETSYSEMGRHAASPKLVEYHDQGVLARDEAGGEILLSVSTTGIHLCKLVPDEGPDKTCLEIC